MQDVAPGWCRGLGCWGLTAVARDLGLGGNGDEEFGVLATLGLQQGERKPSPGPLSPQQFGAR